MSAGTLYVSGATKAHALRIKAVAAIAGVSLTESTESKADLVSIPAFVAKDGFAVSETTAIARYLASAHGANTTLLGSGPTDAAVVDQWVSYFDNEIGTPIAYINKLLTEQLPYNKTIDQGLRTAVNAPLAAVEKFLATRTFLVGQRISLADISAASVLAEAYSTVVDKEARASHPNTFRFFETVINQPSVASLFKGVALADKAKQFTAGAAKPKEKKAPAPSAAAEKPKEKPAKKVADDDDDEPLVPEEPKKKNPLDDLPKSTFNLEDWKRSYSNLDTRGAGGSLEWFYQNFDAEGFSIWRVDFKYSEELTQVFMSSNQIGGFFNRLEGSRKYLFGSVGVLGTANNSHISGVLVLRGQDHKAVVDVAPDWESYEYVKLDLSKDADKQFFEAALAWDLEVDGKKWADGKSFK